MKNTKQLSFSIIISLMLAFGCGKVNTEPNQPPIEISCRILTTQGVETQSIRQGDNFVISFLATNKSNKDWYISHGSVMSSDFAILYSKLSEGSNGLSLVGSPYASTICSFQAGVTIPANGSYRVDVPWVTDKSLTNTPGCGINIKTNLPLPVGYYTTDMSDTIEIFRSNETYKISLAQSNFAFNIE
jgi:hypothetical protein